MIKLRERMDIWILASVAFLVGVGILAIFSAGTSLGEEKFGSSYFFLKRHLPRVLLGALAFYCALGLRMETLRKAAPYAFGVSLVLLVLTFKATEVRNTHRFLSVASVSLQPVEIARVCLIVFLAALLSRPDGARRFSPRAALLTCGAIAVPCALVFLQPSFSCGAALLVTGLIIVFVAGLPLRYVCVGVILGAPLLLAIAHSHEYQWKRLVDFYTRHTNPLGSEWQLTQSLIGLGSGGLWGVGFGESVQKKFFLPDAHTDFIFAVFGEERGFIGSVAVLGAYLIILWRGFQAAARAERPFCSLLAAGITGSIMLFILVNLSVVTGIIPTTGLPLPFMSYGGSALVMNLFSMGLLCNVNSRITRYAPGTQALFRRRRFR